MPDVFQIDDFEWDKENGILIPKGKLYDWGFYPLFFQIQGKTRTIEFEYEMNLNTKQFGMTAIFLSKELPNVKVHCRSYQRQR